MVVGTTAVVEVAACKLHIFNYTSEAGLGYHFDSLKCCVPQVTDIMNRAEGDSSVGEQRVKNAAEQLVTACLFSKTGDWESTTKIMQQDWVAQWNGWQELQENVSEDMCMNVATRLYAIGSRNMHASSMSNAAALQALEDAGLRLQRAHSFRMNNCLIDSIILCLCNSGHLPSTLPANMVARCQLTVQCRDALAKTLGAVRQPNAIGQFPYLDAARDGPAVVKYLFEEFKVIPLPPLVLCVHDRFADSFEASFFNRVQMPWSAVTESDRTTELHIFNYTDHRGQSYHFDSLKLKPAAARNVDARARKGTCAQKSSGTILLTKADRDDAQGETAKPEAEVREADTAEQPNMAARSIESEILGADQKAVDVSKLKEETSGSKGARVRSRTPPHGRPAGAAASVPDLTPEQCASDDEGPAMCVAIGGAYNSQREVQNLLQAFFRGRCENITIYPTDAQEVIAAWNDPVRLRQKLLVLLQAGLTYADAGEAAAERLRQQWAAYYLACTQGPTRKRDAEGGWRLESAQESPRPDAAPPRKRLRGKTTVPIAPDASPTTATLMENSEPALQGDEYLLKVWETRHGNPDPRAALDDKLANLIQVHLRRRPLLPIWLESDTSEFGYDTRNFFCSFKNCDFETDCENTFEEHLQDVHSEALHLDFSPSTQKRRVLSTYRRALTAACQQQAPCAHRAIDRRCLRQYRIALGEDRVGAGICFVCARRFPYSHGMEATDEIQWKSLLDRTATNLLGLPLDDARVVLGYDAYWSQYGVQHAEAVQARLREDLRDWCAVVHTKAGNFEIICCPEDKQCRNRCRGNEICTSCYAPVCYSCHSMLREHKQLPPEALANDMLIFYPPKQLYEQEVTFMELVCASPCFTSMTCFSLEKKVSRPSPRSRCLHAPQSARGTGERNHFSIAVGRFRSKVAGCSIEITRRKIAVAQDRRGIGGNHQRDHQSWRVGQREHRSRQNNPSSARATRCCARIAPRCTRKRASSIRQPDVGGGRQASGSFARGWRTSGNSSTSAARQRSRPRAKAKGSNSSSRTSVGRRRRGGVCDYVQAKCCCERTDIAGIW